MCVSETCDSEGRVIREVLQEKFVEGAPFISHQRAEHGMGTMQPLTARARFWPGLCAATTIYIIFTCTVSTVTAQSTMHNAQDEHMIYDDFAHNKRNGKKGLFPSYQSQCPPLDCYYDACLDSAQC